MDNLASWISIVHVNSYRRSAPESSEAFAP